jgi:hypothetical protein
VIAAPNRDRAGNPRYSVKTPVPTPRSLTLEIMTDTIPPLSLGTTKSLTMEPTRSLPRIVASVGSALLSLALLSPLAFAADQIILKNGKSVAADEVIADTFEKVEYKRGQAISNQAAGKVKSVVYGDAPDSYKLGLEKRDAGEFENATNLLKAAIASPGVRGWIKVQGNLELAETLRRWAAKDRTKFALAIAAYDEVLKDPKSRLRPVALLGRAQAHIGSGNLDKAKADLQTLKTEANANKYGATYELLADYTLANAYEDAARPEAKQAFASLQTFAQGYSAREDLEAEDRAYAAELAGLARLAQGRVLIRENKAPDAQRQFEAIANDAKEVAAVRAAALVGVGLAQQAQNKLKEAQFTFAKVRVLYHEQGESVAEATYSLGVIAEALGAAEPRGAALAQDYFKEVVQRHSATRFASKAQEKIR